MKNRYIGVGILLALGGTAAGLALYTGDDDALVPPYRFRLSKPPDADAEIAFHEARVKRNPESALDRAALAAAYAGQARRTNHAAGYVRAEREARTSLELLPQGNEGAKLVLARVAEAGHDFPEALRLASEVLRARPRHPEALSIQVTSNLGLGRPIDASRAADQLVDRRPTLFAYALRALARAATGRDEEALNDFERGIRLEDVGEADVSAWARVLLARFHLQRGRWKPAERLLREALRIRSGNPMALHLLGQVHEARGDRVEAERYSEWAAAEGHDPAFLLSQARLKSGDEKLFREVEARLRAEGHRGALARLLLERGRPEDLQEALTLAQEEASRRRNPEGLDTLAWALGRSGRWPEAYGIVQEALQPGTRDRGLYERAAWVARALGRSDEARLYERLRNTLAYH